MMVNEFGYRTYSCGTGCHCMYPSELESQCMIDGKAVLDVFGYGLEHQGKYVGYMIVVIFGLRLFGYLALRFKN